MGMSGYNKKQRGIERRKRTSFVFISAEGANKTETLYFRQLQNQNIQFKFVTGAATDPVKMSKDLISKMTSDGFDAELGDFAYCLIDGDNYSYKNQQIADADNLAREHGFKIILSNPCFEIWFICHKCFSTRQYNSSREVIDEVKQLFPEYSKTKLPKKDYLLENLPSAIANAEKLSSWNKDQGKRQHTVEFQPSTELYQIFKEVHMLNPQTSV